MAGLYTYVRMLFNSEGIDPKTIIPLMKEVGFEPAMGVHDFVHDWGKRHVTLEDVADLALKLHERLRGHNIQYEITTVR